MSPYPILSALLDYPTDALLDALPEIEARLAGLSETQSAVPMLLPLLSPLLVALASRPLIESQQAYVATFDRNRSHSLHLFEHVHGESRARGQAMIDLLEEYRQLDLDVHANELPDFIPLFLEVLGVALAPKAQALLDETVHIFAVLDERLTRCESPYAAVFAVLQQLSTVQPESLLTPPVHDMDEALAALGVGPDGVEPLLMPRHRSADNGAAAGQTVHFYPRDVGGESAPSTPSSRPIHAHRAKEMR